MAGSPFTLYFEHVHDGGMFKSNVICLFFFGGVQFLSTFTADPKLVSMMFSPEEMHSTVLNLLRLVIHSTMTNCKQVR